MGKVLWNKKKICWLLVSVSLLTIAVSGCTSRQNCRELEFYYRADYFNLYDLNGSSFPNSESLETVTRQYIREIEDVWELYNWWEDVAPEADTLEISVEMGSSKKVCAYGLRKTSEKTLNTTVGLELGALQAGYGNDSSLAHELTHIICGSSFSRSLEDGLCDYVQYRVGMQRFIWQARPDWSVAEVMKLKLLYYQSRAAVSDEKVAEVMETVGMAQGYSYGNTPKGNLWYVYSQCFVEYLAETYGMEKMLSLIRLGEDEGAYREYLGKPYEEVKADWYTGLDALEPSMTVEELNEAERDYLANYK